MGLTIIQEPIPLQTDADEVRQQNERRFEQEGIRQRLLARQSKQTT
jgi:hypothetical protein